ncbi:hypothetical protein [Citreicella sp. C3M06]|nr:hypothetical protein [Citreicella sp. C3M06]
MTGYDEYMPGTPDQIQGAGLVTKPIGIDTRMRRVSQTILRG